MIYYFLTRSTENSADLNYIAVKFLVYLTETTEYQNIILANQKEDEDQLRKYVDKIVEFSHRSDQIEKNDFRSIKEGIRFLINLSLIFKDTSELIASGICSMCKACIRSNNPNNTALAFVGLKLVSQNSKCHGTILKEQSLFEYILRLDHTIVQSNAKAITVLCFNLLINTDTHAELLKKNILALVNKLVLHADEVGVSQIQAVISSLIKSGHTEELMKQGAEDILLHMLKRATDPIINSIYQTLYVRLLLP